MNEIEVASKAICSVEKSRAVQPETDVIGLPERRFARLPLRFDWTALLLAAAITFGSVQPSAIGASSGLTPAVYRLEGYLDSAPTGQTVYMKLLLGVGAAERTLCVTKYSRQGSGDPFLIFRSLGKTTPNFFLIGPPKTLDDFMSAASGARVSGIFYFRRGMNVLEFDPHSLKIE